jgi:hypothetical protein
LVMVNYQKMKTTISIFSSLMLLALLQAPQAITQNTYYVSTFGNDANAGRLASPWRNIEETASVMQAGDKCFIRATLVVFNGLVKKKWSTDLKAGSTILLRVFSSQPSLLPMGLRTEKNG